MSFQLIRWVLIGLTALVSALSAGIFFAFSTFVMQALGRQSPTSGIAVMQSINVTVINPWFMAVFFGPVVVGVGVALMTMNDWQQPSSMYMLLGLGLYLVGTVGVTITGNVPLNDALAGVDPASETGLKLWQEYLVDWTLWNHIRTVAAFVAAVAFTVSLYQALISN